jgi:hypothetical protein
MDIKRASKSKLRKRIRTGILVVIGLTAVGGITLVLGKLKACGSHSRSIHGRD